MKDPEFFFFFFGFIFSIPALMLGFSADSFDRLDELLGRKKDPGRWVPIYCVAGLALACMAIGFAIRWFS